MKKSFFCVLICFIVFSCISCQQNSKSKIKNELISSKQQLITYLGMTKEEVISELAINEHTAKSENKGDTLIYVLNNEVRFDNNSFHPVLMFEKKNSGKFYGFYFILENKNNKYELEKTIDNLLEQLKNEYGEPSTYSGYGNSIIANKNKIIDFFENKAPVDLIENWLIENKSVKCTLSLSLNTPNNILISLKFIKEIQ